MDFREIAARLRADGYPPRKADAKIAHDIILKAIEDAGFHDNVTIKGGIVMSGITDAVRRATIDMDWMSPLKLLWKHCWVSLEEWNDNHLDAIRRPNLLKQVSLEG